MNTVFREEVVLDMLIETMIDECVATKEEILRALGKYWFCGEIKRIVEDGFIRIVPDNIGTVRLLGVK